MTKNKLILLHLEDDSLWQTFLAATLRALPQVAHVVSVATSAEGIALLPQLRPDLVVLDVVLPDADGLVVARQIAEGTRPAPLILLTTSRRDIAILQAANEPHVAGLIWKSGAVVSQISAALQAIASGGKLFLSGGARIGEDVPRGPAGVLQTAFAPGAGAAALFCAGAER